MATYLTEVYNTTADFLTLHSSRVVKYYPNTLQLEFTRRLAIDYAPSTGFLCTSKRRIACTELALNIIFLVRILCSCLNHFLRLTIQSVSDDWHNTVSTIVTHSLGPQYSNPHKPTVKADNMAAPTGKTSVAHPAFPCYEAILLPLVVDQLVAFDPKEYTPQFLSLQICPMVFRTSPCLI